MHKHYITKKHIYYRMTSNEIQLASATFPIYELGRASNKVHQEFSSRVIPTQTFSLYVCGVYVWVCVCVCVCVCVKVNLLSLRRMYSPNTCGHCRTMKERIRQRLCRITMIDFISWFATQNKWKSLLNHYSAHLKYLQMVPAVSAHNLFFIPFNP